MNGFNGWMSTLLGGSWTNGDTNMLVVCEAVILGWLHLRIIGRMRVVRAWYDRTYQ